MYLTKLVESFTSMTDCQILVKNSRSGKWEQEWTIQIKSCKVKIDSFPQRGVWNEKPPLKSIKFTLPFSARHLVLTRSTRDFVRNYQAGYYNPCYQLQPSDLSARRINDLVLAQYFHMSLNMDGRLLHLS